ncbi:transketolase C-terminal domain-containing protein, partial [Pseudomonas aeruginosa]
KVVAPGTAGDVYSILRAAIRDNNPVIYIEPKALFGRKGEVELGKVGVIGKGDIKAEGTDVTLVSWGRMLERSLQAAEELKQEGISVEVV